MKKGLLAGLVVAAAAVGAGGYYFASHQKGAEAGSLAYVPADTLLFAGGLEPMPWAAMTAFRDQFNFGMKPDQVNALIDEMIKADPESPDAAPAGARLAVSLYAEYMNAVLSKEFKPQMLGLGETVDSAFYTVGALPVIRVALADKAAFDAFLAKAEERVKVKGEEVKLKEFSYKRYPLISDAEQPVYLAIGERDGFVVVTLDTGNLIPSAEGLEVAFGLTKPAQSLATAGTLQALVKEQGLKPFSLGYLNHEALIRTLTRADSPVAKLLDKVSHGEATKSMAAFRTPECQTDIEGMAALWPRSVFGYTELDTSGSPLRADSLFKIVSTDKQTMEQLQKLRGFLPQYSTEQSKLSYQLGLNMDELTPVLTNLWTRAIQAKFQCAPLVAAQDQLKQTNPALLGAMTGMIQGVQGVGIDVQDLKLGKAAAEGQLPSIDALSFVATLSSKQPQQLWGMLAMMQPEFASLKLPESGQSIDLPLPLPVTLPSPIKLGLYGNHIAVFSGDQGKALAESLAKQELKPNGFVHFGLDYGLLADAMDMALKEEMTKLEAAADAAAEEAVAAAANNSAGADEAAPADEFGMPQPSAAERKAQAEKQVAELKSVQQMMQGLRGAHISSDMDFVTSGIDMRASMLIPKK